MWLWFIFTSLILQLLVTTVCNATKNTFPNQILNNAYGFLYYSVDFPNINGNHWAFALWCLLSCTHTFLHLVLMDNRALGVRVFRRAVSFKDNTGASNLILLEHQSIDQLRLIWGLLYIQVKFSALNQSYDHVNSNKLCNMFSPL